MGLLQAHTYTVLYTFTGGTDGGDPYGGVIRDSAGNLYSTTYLGGLINSTCTSGCGVVFKLDARGRVTVLHSFAGPPADGAGPQAGLIADSAGNLYGTTTWGGAVTSACPSGCGIVFKIDSRGRETVLYNFAGSPSDGSRPQAALVRDPAGNLYGTTYQGGHIAKTCGTGCGVVFKIEPGGTERVLYRFTGGSDGANPEAGLMLDSAGNLFGTTSIGGRDHISSCLGYHNLPLGCGVLFKLSSAGAETVLYGFYGTGDGRNPAGDVIRDSSGNLYTTTNMGGSGNGGVVFRLDTNGKPAVVHSFPGFSGDGGYPYAGVIRDSAGGIYGTTSGGGYTNGGACSSGCGVVYQVTAGGKETILHTFTGGPDGGNPYAGLVKDPAGNLYGTASFGGGTGGPCGSIGCGVVFQIQP